MRAVRVKEPKAINDGIATATIHKLEYFVNARIIGGRINARAWEILIAMLAMDAWFGIAGAIAAPVFYAYVKEELQARRLI